MIYFLCLLFLIIHESGLGDNENWEDTNALVKNFLPEIKFDLSHVYVSCFSFVFGYGNETKKNKKLSEIKN